MTWPRSQALRSCHHHIGWMSPGHHASICQNGGKSSVCATNLLHVPEPIWTLELSPPEGPWPHVTTDPWIHLPRAQQRHRPLLSSRRIVELSAPLWASPHVTILSPPTHHKANALPLVAIFGCWATAAIQSPSWSPESRRESVGFKRCPSAVASLRKPCTTFEQLFSGQQRYQTPKRRRLHTVHLARKLQVRSNFELYHR